MLTRIACFATLSLLLMGCMPPADEQASLVLTNGNIVTLDDDVPQASAIAIVDGRIAAVGSEEDVEEFIGGSTQVIDLEGKTAIPGLIEGHGHFMGMGQAKMILDLTQAESWQDMIDMVAEAAQQAEPGEWILGRGWHQEKWNEVPAGAVEGVPPHQEMSDASPENPVLLTHASGHASFANALALELGRVSPETPNPDGGEIVHDITGEPTGLLRETAQGLVRRALNTYLNQRSEEEIEAHMRQQAELASEEALRKGITSFQDAGSGFGTIDFFKGLVDEGALPLRLYVMVRGQSHEEMEAELPDYYLPDYGDHRLNVRSIKMAIDGALGPHGAWLLEPYEDLPRSAGLNLTSIESIEQTAAIAMKHGYQLNVHAIGDRANKEVLDIYQNVFEANPENEDVRWRIEHAQHLHPDDIGRMADLGVIASMQGIHATSDGPWVLKRLGEKRAREGAYVWQSLWQAGAVVTNGTDAPVEDVDPIASYHATVTRLMNDGTPFFPEERLTREQALRSYTINNAFAAFEEDIKGTLSVGKLGDITVLSQDIMTVPDEELLNTEIVYTIVGGVVAYQQSASE